MITKLTGTINRVAEDELRLQVGPIEFQVLIPESVRSAVQMQLGNLVTLHIIDYLEGNPARGGKMIPRMIGFLDELDLEFFDLLGTVDGVGIKTALKAMSRSPGDMSTLIQEQDVKGLALLPGISSNLAERIIAKLRKKVSKFVLLNSTTKAITKGSIDPKIAHEALEVVTGMGLSENEARQRIDAILQTGKKFTNSGDLVTEVFKR